MCNLLIFSLITKYYWGDQVKEIWAGIVARMGEIINAYIVLVGKPEGKRLRGRPRHRWEDNTRINGWEIVWEGVDWIHLAHDRPVAGLEPSASIKCGEFLD
jgi:hypothetical protein